MTKPITSRGLITLCGLRRSLQRQKSISTSQESFRAFLPIVQHCDTWSTSAKRIPNQCAKNKPSGAIVCAIYLDYYATLSVDQARHTPADAILSTRCGVPDRQFQTRSEQRPPPAMLLWDVAAAAVGAKLDKARDDADPKTLIAPGWAMSCLWIRFGLSDIKRPLHFAQYAWSQISAGRTPFFCQLATPLVASRT